jgi:hypothetical protein
MNYKKTLFTILAAILFFSISIGVANASCSIKNLKDCDRAGLVSIIKELIMNRQPSNANDLMVRFEATELVSNNFPESIEFWTQADCPWALKWGYDIPYPGYNVASCSKGEKGSHGGCPTCIMSKIRLEKGDFEYLSNNWGAGWNGSYGFHYSYILNSHKEKTYSVSDKDGVFKMEFSIPLDELNEQQKKSLSHVSLYITISDRNDCSVKGLKDENIVPSYSSTGKAYIGDYQFEKVSYDDTAMHTTYYTDYYVGRVRDGHCAIVKKEIIKHSCAPYDKGMCEYVDYDDTKASLNLYNTFASLMFKD